MPATGIIGDLHLDLAALERTLAGPLAECERLVVAGDFLDRGPDDASAVLDRLLELRATLLVGNHELAYLGGPAFPRMMEERNIEAGRRLRDLVIDGRLVAAAAVGDVLVVHGGVTQHFWQRHLREACGSDPAAIARELNRCLLRAVVRRDYSHEAFAALRERERGPFWAHLHDDLVARGLPPLRQAVGHVVVEHDEGWLGDPRGGAGEVFPLNWGPERTDGLVGHLRL